MELASDFNALLSSIQPGEDDLIEYRSETFRVVAVERDGQGGAKLILHRA